MGQIIEKSLARWREQIAYLFFGVLTTAVNYGVFLFFYLRWGESGVLGGNLAAFLAATTFAYLTNKCFVFESRSWRGAVLVREAASFVAARLLSLGIEEAGLYLAADVLSLGRYALFGIDGVMMAKVLLSFLAVILNYFFSKFLIFRKSKPEKGKIEK